MRSLPVFIAFAAAAALAQQPSEQAWLDSKPAAEFRERVVQLALIYGESDGIDLQDFKVQAKEVANVDADCSVVLVETSNRAQTVRRETVRACRSH